eukprot:1314864-Amorphochlora_amoeboformis.AAC.2
MEIMVIPPKYTSHDHCVKRWSNLELEAQTLKGGITGLYWGYLRSYLCPRVLFEAYSRRKSI